MRILFVAALHHPEVLQAAIAATPAGEQPPLFPTSAAQHFWEKALKKRGHVVDVFYRNLPAWGGELKSQRYTNRWTPARVATAIAYRIPPEFNPEYRLRNQRLIDKAREFKPDWLWMTGDNTVITASTLAQIKAETGCKVIYATGTSPIVFSRPVERKAAPLYDLVIVNDYYHGIQWLELGAKHMDCMPMVACDPAFHHPYPLTHEQRRAFTCDIAFVGTLIPDNLYSQRIQALEALHDFDLGVWSVHEVPSSLRPKARGGALGEDMLEVLSAAKMTINTHGDFMRYGGNMRLFEAAAVGVFQIADNLPGVQRWFTEGETIITYNDLDDLRAKVHYYLDHDTEREHIVQRAREHVYTHHTYTQRVERLEALVSSIS
ncbi:MAG: glycosyltransferase [Chloroflexi bacterium]|nr:glycosyltransferase [Chloroflexota bacterium]MCC6893048.1 glycosyltransferase [Anaerolineae bacterium]